ncbi:conserved hypothetical protein [Catenulispora acidiphila DSM 44928]|uniref:AbiJ-NTD3 domain-containing protein n=2 Tax=Catenulispora TaxID=414878 RepID=C7Q5L4_CATAD|nr:conserved hypothetical protein [Catenulispora acidiphila DSM 44928]
MKSYEVPDECVRLGLAAGSESEAFEGKFRYVMARLRHLELPRLLAIAQRCINDHDVPELQGLVDHFGHRGVDGEFKNLIFAADGPKPELFFVDAVNNEVEITKNAEHCLIYTKPLTAQGLTWADLVGWWRDNCPQLRDADDVVVGQHLYKRLFASLASEPEQIVFRAYCSLYRRAGGFELPALVPQVYLHYDPIVASMRRGPRPRERQRMDFLLLLPRRERIVVEVDGKHHYADGSGVASPERYAKMVAEDRRLRLDGYEVFRFGGSEFTDPSVEESILSFFIELLDKHGVPTTAGVSETVDVTSRTMQTK